MKKKQRERSSAPDTLAHVQTRHAKQLKKIEKARARLEKASRKLRSLEEEIATLARHDTASSQSSGAVDPQPTTRRCAHLLFNPGAKAVRDGVYSLEQVVDCLHSHGFDVEIGLKTSGKVAREFVKRAVEQQSALVIVAAGDGTIEDVAGELAGTQTTLGILPLGTMNNLARSLGVPLDLVDACTLLRMGATRQIDLGRVKTLDKPRGIYFLESAGVGLSALAMPMGQDEEKGRWVQLLATLGKAMMFKATSVTVTCDDGAVLQARTQVVTISSAPLFGKNMLIAPDAKMDDGLLDVALYDGMSKVDLMRHFTAIAGGQRVDNPHVSFQRVSRVCVTADEPVAANADLQVVPQQQVWEFDILPRALAVLAGNGMALTLPVDAAPAPPLLSGPQPPRDASSR